jgi:hypothetical protein
MNRFDAGRVNAIPERTLLDQAIGLGAQTAQAYLCCGLAPGGVKIFCLHCPTRYATSLEGDITGWDNLCFAFLGELVQGTITNVLFPEDAFTTAMLCIPSIEYIQQHLEDLMDAPYFPPMDDDDPNSTQVTIRKFMYLPAVYVPLLISSSSYSLKEVWTRLYPALMQRQEVEICTPLLHWLQAASIGTTPAAPNQIMMPPHFAMNICAPAADELLLNHHLSVLNQFLPDLKAPVPGLESALSQMATALIAQTNDGRVAREQRRADEEAPKLPSEKFGVLLPILLEYLLIPDEQDLPELWHKWANSNKRQEFHVLKDSLAAFARSNEAFCTTSPIVTAKLVQDLLSFNFVGDSADDISTGLHPFVITDGNAEQRHGNLEVARLYGLLTSGDVNCSLSNLDALKA